MRPLLAPSAGGESGRRPLRPLQRGGEWLNTASALRSRWPCSWLDQLTKWLVTGPLGLNQLGDQLVLLPIFNFTYTQNNGISLGLLNATNPVGRWMLVAVDLGDRRRGRGLDRPREEPDRQVALGMVLGGALGNILDRVRFGYVVDFADLHFGDFRPFLVFNVGDAAISIAVVILLLRAFLTRKERPEETIEHA